MLSTQQAKLLKALLMQRTQNRGFVLITVVSITIIILAILGAYSTLTTIDQNVSLSIQDSNDGFFAAEAGLNVRADTVRTIFQGFNRPAGTSPTGATPCLEGNLGGGDFQCITYDIGGFDVSTYVTEFDGNPRAIVIPSGEDFAGLNAQEYRYSAIAQATRLDDQPQAILEMVFRSRLVPLFQFAVFYDNDLEIFPGPPMTLAGPIHTNSNLFMGAGSGLTVDGSISSAGNFFMGRKHTNSDSGICGAKTFSPPAPGRTVNLLGNPTQLFCSGTRVQYTSANVNNVGATNLISPNRAPLEVPAVNTFAPVPGNEHFDLADLRLALNLNTNPPRVEVRTPANTLDITLTNQLNACQGRTLTINDDVLTADYTPLYERSVVSHQPPPPATIWNGNRLNNNQGNATALTGVNGVVRSYFRTDTGSGTTGLVRNPAFVAPPFYDHREGLFINMMNVDVGQLLNCIQTDNSLIGGEPLNTTGEGGLVFHLTIDGPNSGGQNNYGIRLVNGQSLTSSNLPQQTGACGTTGQPCGLTIVSDQSVYVQGNYNAPDGAGGTWDAVNGQPNRIPASIIADTLTVLSDDPDPTLGWDDRRSINLNLGLTANNNDNPFRLASTDNTFRDTVLRIRRRAVPTEYNIAILAGTESSCNTEGGPCNGAYNGGFENFPRMLENWDGIGMRYRGSIVSLDNPQTKNRLNEGLGYTFRNPPQRLWAFDTRFRRAENLPPLSPRFVYLVQELFVREFEQ